MSYPTIDTVKVVCNGPVLEVVLNRSKQANALRPEEHECLHQIWQKYVQDDERRVAIITGEGNRFFSAGNDLAYALANDDFPMPETGLAGLCRWFDREKPIIAAVNGVAAGGGFEIALACDMVVADENATFSLPETKVGTYAGAGGLTRLPGLVGEKIAMEMILTGDSISANRAYEIGLVNAVTESGAVMDKARALAEKILEGGPRAITVSKRIINQTRGMSSLDSAQQVSDRWGEYLFEDDEFQEGVNAFLEKRKPTWIKE